MKHSKRKQACKQAKIKPEELSKCAYEKTVAEESPTPDDPFSKRNFKRMKQLLEQRVSPERFEHSLAVAKTAAKLAKAYDADVRVARMAGLLHDWDKALLPEELKKRVTDYHLAYNEEVINDMPWILHGPTAAAVLADQFPEFGAEVFSAIEHHTVAIPRMSKLGMIIFTADKIEPTHEVAPYRRLYKQIGKISLEDLFFEVQKAGLFYLVRVNRPIVPESIKAWNYYCAQKRSYKKKIHKEK